MEPAGALPYAPLLCPPCHARTAARRQHAALLGASATHHHHPPSPPPRVPAARRNYTAELSARGVRRTAVEEYIRTLRWGGRGWGACRVAVRAQGHGAPRGGRPAHVPAAPRSCPTAPGRRRAAQLLCRLLPRRVPLQLQPVRLRGRRRGNGNAPHWCAHGQRGGGAGVGAVSQRLLPRTACARACQLAVCAVSTLLTASVRAHALHTPPPAAFLPPPLPSCHQATPTFFLF